MEPSTDQGHCYLIVVSMHCRQKHTLWQHLTAFGPVAACLAHSFDRQPPFGALCSKI